MQLDEVTAEIRPRSDWEAVDLGFAMVRRDFWRCLIVWWLPLLLPVVLTAWWLWDYPLLWALLVWWWKPAGSRMVLFELSRRLFGEKPGWRSVWKQVPRVWWRRFFHRFVVKRFSPWLPLTLAVDDLEGLKGKQYRLRASQLARRGDGPVTWIYLLADLATLWIALGLVGVASMLLPEGQDGPWWMAMETWSIDDPFEIPLILLRTTAVCLVVAMSLVDLFVTGAGFGLYVNNRTWIEGWDVELAFKRLGRRLGKAAALVALFSIWMIPGFSQAQEERSPAEVIAEVKSHADFTVHTVTDYVPPERSSNSEIPGWLRWLANLFEVSGRELLMIFAISVVVLILALVGWLLWRYRHVFFWKGAREKSEERNPSARTVMGMEVAPESLPDDVPTTVLELWRRGRLQEALGLLYRGAISRAIEVGRVEIQESDTEGDCLRRVRNAGAAAHPDYFDGVTKAWMRLAYAGVAPADPEVESLCAAWPFGERRNP